MSKLLILIFTCCIGCASANELKSEMNGKIPAAWVWEISNNNRQIYLVGEMHVFFGVTEKDVDFKLGDEIYDQVSMIFREAKQFKNSPVTPENKISKKVGDRTWRNISEKLELVVNLRKYPAEKKHFYFKIYLKS